MFCSCAVGWECSCVEVDTSAVERSAEIVRRIACAISKKNVKIITHEAALLVLFAITFIFLEMPLNATAAHIYISWLVAAAAFGGPHAKGSGLLFLLHRSLCSLGGLSSVRACAVV